MAVQTYINQLQPVDVSGSFRKGMETGRQDRQQRTVENAFQQYATDPEGAQSALIGAGALPQAAALGQIEDRKVAGQERERQAQLEKLDGLAKLKASTSYSLRQLPEDQRAAALQQMIPNLVAQGIPADQIGTQPLTDQYLDSSIAEGMSLSEKIAAARDQRTFEAGRADKAQVNADRTTDNERQARRDDETGRHNRETEARMAAAVGARSGGGGGAGGKPPSGYRWTPDGDLVPIPGGPADRKDTVGDSKTEMTLRKEFDALPEVKNYRTVANAAKQVHALATATPSANNDIALIYSVMKAYDPTSVVRETEFATAQNATGVPDKVKNQWNKVLKGQRLNADQRAEMARAVATVARASGDRFATIADNYRTYAGQAGGNPDHIVKYERKTTGGQAKSAAAPKAGSVLRFDAQGNPVK